MDAVISSLRIGPEVNFCYIILCPETNQCGLIDPSFEFDRVIEWVKTFNPKDPPTVKYLIATHGHRDHAGGFPQMLERIPHAKVVAHEKEEERLKKINVPLHLSLRDEEEFQIGNIRIMALHTPGHTEGGCCYKLGNQIFTGDTLLWVLAAVLTFPGAATKTFLKVLKD